jgi:hypothetical protein
MGFSFVNLANGKWQLATAKSYGNGVTNAAP